MHILERIFRVNPSLADMFSGPASSLTVYTLRPDVLETLILHQAVLAGDAAGGKLKFKAEPVTEGDQEEVLCAFDSGAPESAVWHDRIMAYIACHDGFISADRDTIPKGFWLDTSYPGEIYPREATPDHFPHSVKDWEALSDAWQVYLVHNWDDEGQPGLPDDAPASWQELRALLTLARLDFHYDIAFLEPSAGVANVAFKAQDKKGSMRFTADRHPDDPLAVIRFSITGPLADTREEGILTRAKLRDLVFQTLAAWHEDAKLSFKSVSDFEERERQLKDLRSEDFHSGLDRPRADIVPFPGTLKKL